MTALAMSTPVPSAAPARSRPSPTDSLDALVAAKSRPANDETPSPKLTEHMLKRAWDTLPYDLKLAAMGLALENRDSPDGCTLLLSANLSHEHIAAANSAGETLREFLDRIIRSTNEAFKRSLKEAGDDDPYQPQSVFVLDLNPTERAGWLRPQHLCVSDLNRDAPVGTHGVLVFRDRARADLYRTLLRKRIVAFCSSDNVHQRKWTHGQAPDPERGNVTGWLGSYVSKHALSPALHHFFQPYGKNGNAYRRSPYLASKPIRQDARALFVDLCRTKGVDGATAYLRTIQAERYDIAKQTRARKAAEKRARAASNDDDPPNRSICVLDLVPAAPKTAPCPTPDVDNENRAGEQATSWQPKRHQASETLENLPGATKSQIARPRYSLPTTPEAGPQTSPTIRAPCPATPADAGEQAFENDYPTATAHARPVERAHTEKPHHVQNASSAKEARHSGLGLSRASRDERSCSPLSPRSRRSSPPDHKPHKGNGHARRFWHIIAPSDLDPQASSDIPARPGRHDDDLGHGHDCNHRAVEPTTVRDGPCHRIKAASSNPIRAPPSPTAAVIDSQSLKSAETGAVKTTRWVTTPA